MKRSFFQYVSLNVLGALGLSGYILADTLFVAHRLGTDGLAALNLAISVFGLINGLGLMLGIALRSVDGKVNLDDSCIMRKLRHILSNG